MKRKPFQPIKCVECGKDFIPTRITNVACSDECRSKRRARRDSERTQRPEYKERKCLEYKARYRKDRVIPAAPKKRKSTMLNFETIEEAYAYEMRRTNAKNDE
jgi:hypothetical protein